MKAFLAATVLLTSTAFADQIACKVSATTTKGSKSFYSLLMEDVNSLNRKLVINENDQHTQIIDVDGNIRVDHGIIVPGNGFKVSYQVSSFEKLKHGRKISLLLNVDDEKYASATADVAYDGSVDTGVTVNDPGYFNYDLGSISLTCTLKEN